MLYTLVHLRSLWTEWFSPEPGEYKRILRFPLHDKTGSKAFPQVPHPPEEPTRLGILVFRRRLRGCRRHWTVKSTVKNAPGAKGFLLYTLVHLRSLWTEWFSPEPGEYKRILRFPLHDKTGSKGFPRVPHERNRQQQTTTDNNIETT